MITVIQAPSPNEAWAEAITRMKFAPVVPSRNGETRELHPAVLQIEDPAGRLITAYGRPVNPAFSLAEVLWILSGRNDVHMLQWYNSRIGDFSDDGETFNAAYGRRIRRDQGDQLFRMIEGLAHDRESRQAVLSIWHPNFDRAGLVELSGNRASFHLHTTKDRACNLISNALIREGALDWVQVMRSNDVIWGTPNNFMQWMHIQEWVARCLEVPVGHYTHFANSLHLYEHHYADAENISYFDLYDQFDGPGEGGYEHAPMMVGYQDFINRLMRAEQQCREFAYRVNDDGELGHYWNAVMCLFMSWTCWKRGDDQCAMDFLMRCGDPVLRYAQMRYYWWFRWYKFDVDHLPLSSYDSGQLGGEAVLAWIMAGSKEPVGSTHE